MASPRFRSRFLHATMYDYTAARLDDLGWISPPINFGTGPVTLIDYQPEERAESLVENTVAISLGDYANDDDEELGASYTGAARSAPYSVFIDVYMAEQALTQAICDDIRDIFTALSHSQLGSPAFYLVDQINQVETTDLIQIENIDGPSRVPGGGIDTFRKHWRAMRIDCRLFFQT